MEGAGTVVSAPLQGGPVSLVSNVTALNSFNLPQGIVQIGVTETTVFLGGVNAVAYFPMVGASGASQGRRRSASPLLRTRTRSTATLAAART
jgi:hypothetical protein